MQKFKFQVCGLCRPVFFTLLVQLFQLFPLFSFFSSTPWSTLVGRGRGPKSSVEGGIKRAAIDVAIRELRVRLRRGVAAARDNENSHVDLYVAAGNGVWGPRLLFSSAQ